MRKFRNAALAATTAAAVAFGGTSIALAEDAAPKSPLSSTTGFGAKGDATRGELLEKLTKPNAPHEIGKATKAEDTANIKDFSSNPEKMPQWARIWREAVNIVAILAGIGAVIGLGNYALNQGLLPQIPW